MLFQFTKVTTASPHTTQEYQPCHGFLWVFAKPPASHFRPRRSGPNYYLPSPRRALKSAAAPGQRQPQPLYPASFQSEPPSSSPKNNLLSQSHLTIDRRRSQQHTPKINCITVYPFTHSVTGKPLYFTNFFGFYIYFSFHLLYPIIGFGHTQKTIAYVKRKEYMYEKVAFSAFV